MNDGNENQPGKTPESAGVVKGAKETKPTVKKPAATEKGKQETVPLSGAPTDEKPAGKTRDALDETFSIFGWGD